VAWPCSLPRSASDACGAYDVCVRYDATVQRPAMRLGEPAAACLVQRHPRRHPLTVLLGPPRDGAGPGGVRGRDTDRENSALRRSARSRSERGGGGSLAGALKRVLTAFAAHDAALGYVQSMNFLAAFLLLAGVAEEDAFWCLVVLVEDVVPGYFCEGMVAAKVCVCVCGVHWLLLLPRLCVHACLLACTPPGPNPNPPQHHHSVHTCLALQSCPRWRRVVYLPSFRRRQVR
jgi:hypothetical protein